MFERRNIQRTYLKISREVKDFLLSDKSREFFIFLFFFFVAGGFYALRSSRPDCLGIQTRYDELGKICF